MSKKWWIMIIVIILIIGCGVGILYWYLRGCPEIYHKECENGKCYCIEDNSNGPMIYCLVDDSYIGKYKMDICSRGVDTSRIGSNFW